MPDVHARFSPSSAERLIHCPPSLRLGEEAEPEETSEYAQEGTEAHSLCEHLLREKLGEPTKDPRSKLSHYDAEMESCAIRYRDEVCGIYEQLRLEDPETLISVEQRVDFSEYADNAFGTSDCIVLGNRHLYVIDFKYGKGVPVSAVENPQLKCYALGAYLAFGPLYEIDNITLFIYQPRISKFSQFTLTTEELLTWGETVLKPAADKALKGEGEFSCGSWCKFCRARNICRKRAEEYLALAKYDFAPPDTLEDDEIEDIIGKVSQIKDWAEDVKKYALQRALEGHKWKKWKIVEGRSNRRFSDEKEAFKKVEEAGFTPYERKPLTLTGIEELLGKKKFAELLGKLVIKPKGAPTLVPVSDEREEEPNLREIFSPNTD